MLAQSILLSSQENNLYKVVLIYLGQLGYFTEKISEMECSKQTEVSS